MADFGGVIKLGGVNEYKTALANVRQQLRETGSALSAVSAEFAASDKTEQDQVYTFKQLNDILSQQKAAYEKLQTTYNKMRNTYAENESYLNKLNNQYTTEKSKLEIIGKTLGTTSSEYKKQETIVAELKKSITDATTAQENNATQLSKVKTSLNDAKKAYSETSTKIKDFSGDIDDSNEKANKASTGGYTILKNTVANLLTGAFQKLSGLISGQFSDAIKRVDNINAFGIALKNLGFSTEDVTTATQQLTKGIEGLPTSLPEIMQIQKQFLALTGSMQEATDITLALNNATLAGGQGQEIANSALTQWYQIIANGKPDLQSWRIINQAMPGQLNQIAESLMGAGARGNDLFNAWKNGTVTTEQITQALVKLNKQGSGSMASFEEQAKGASSGIQTSWSNLKLAITNGLANLITEIGQANITSVINDLKVALKGAFDVAKVALNFILTHGNEINTILTVAASILVPLLVATKVGTAIKTMSEAFGTLGSVLGNFKTILSTVKTAFTALNAVMAANPILAVVAAVAALTAVFITLWNTNEDFRNFFINAWENIKNTVSVVVEAIKGYFNNLWESIQNIFGGLVGFFQTVWDGVVSVFSSASAWFGKVFSDAWSGISYAFSGAINFFGNIWNFITSTFSQVGGWFANVFSNAWNAISYAFSPVFSFFSNVWNSITNVFSGAVGWFGGIFSSVWNSITAPFANVFNWFTGIGSNMLKGIWEGLSSGVEWLKNKITGWVGNVLDFIKRLFGISSPSKVMRDKVGKQLALGIGQGFSEEMENVADEMKDSLPEPSALYPAGYNFENNNTNQNLDYYTVVAAFEQALGNMSVELDDENVGKFIKKTVTKAIYA